MRTQLAQPNEHVVSPETFNELFTTHGVTMIFFAVIPMQIGAFGNYLVPLMIGARDMAFPRMNALSYWLFLASGMLHLRGRLQRPRAERRLVRLRAARARSATTPASNVDFYALGADLHRHLVDATARSTWSSRSSRTARPECR